MKSRDSFTHDALAHRLARIGVVGLLCALSAGSAILTKRATSGAVPPLAAKDRAAEVSPAGIEQAPPVPTVAATPEYAPIAALAESKDEAAAAQSWIGEDGREYGRAPEGYERYFNGRPLVVDRVIWMTTTAYSPDERSCGKWADGFTASMRSVWTNGMELVAADRRVLEFGSLVSIPGYADGRAVPVLDVGGAIKGARLDLLYPTHNRALQWGVQRLPVTVWKYADEVE